MKGFVGVTGNDWFAFLSQQPGIDEVNFWQPSGTSQFRSLAPGETFLFKLHAPHHYIVGGGFFARHAKQFKNRPIAWHIVSDPSVGNHEAGQSGKRKKKGGKKKQKPAFSVMVHYHRFVDGDKGYGKLLLLKNKYLEKLMSQTRSELESLRGKGDDPTIFDRIAELDRKLVELEDFKERLERMQEGKDSESRIFVRWKSSEEQPQGWRPDINDGAKINIAPWERLGMFPIKEIVGEVEMGTD